MHGNINVKLMEQIQLCAAQSRKMTSFQKLSFLTENLTFILDKSTYSSNFGQYQLSFHENPKNERKVLFVKAQCHLNSACIWRYIIHAVASGSMSLCIQTEEDNKQNVRLRRVRVTIFIGEKQ